MYKGSQRHQAWNKLSRRTGPVIWTQMVDSLKRALASILYQKLETTFHSITRVLTDFIKREMRVKLALTLLFSKSGFKV